MKHILPFGAALAFLSTVFAACTMDFDQFQPTGGSGGTGGTGGACASECCSAADCPAPAGACVVAACDNGTCGEAPVTDGTALPTQTVGDCKKQVCQGGAVVTVNDDNDLPDDNKDCTQDLCNGGSPASMPEPGGTTCSAGVCDGLGACVECLLDADCPAEEPNCDVASHQCVPTTCSDGEENGDETDVDCGGGTCPPCPVGDDCSAGTDCTSGVCAPNGKCAAPTCTDSVKNGSETDVDCGGTCSIKCGPDKGCDENGDCAGNECSGVGGTCVPNCGDGAQNGNETDVDCGGGTCMGCAVGKKCAGDGANCLSGTCGGNDLCAPKPVGAMCVANNECQSGQCADGVCCSMICNGLCRSCALPGSVGTCSFIPSGEDPDEECAGAQVCNGAGACRKVAGQACNNANECLTGLSCVDGVCCENACSGLCKACNIAGSLGMCVNIPNGEDPNNECTGQQVCNGDGACTN